MILAVIVDLEPLFTLVIWPALGIVATAIAAYFVKKLTASMDEKTQQSIRVVVNGILQAGLQAAQAKVASANIQHPDVQSAIVGNALNYASTHAETALAKMGIDLKTEAGQTQLREKIEAMLAPAVMVAVSSPDTVSVATAATIVNPQVPVGVPVADPAAPAVAVQQLTAGAAPPVA